MFGLAAIAAVAAMAFIGASSASAKFNTVLCEVLEGLVCPEGREIANDLEDPPPYKHIHLVNSALPEGPGTPAGTPTLLNSTANVLCLTVLVLATPLLLGTAPTPQIIHTDKLISENCGTNSTHNNCTFTTEELPLFHLLKIGLDEGSALALNGNQRMKCTIGGFIKINCVYELTNILYIYRGPQALPKSPNGDLHAQNTPLELVEGGGLCPEKTALDFLLLPLAAGSGSGEHYEGPIYVTE
jgi:hypothetical protein